MEDLSDAVAADKPRNAEERILAAAIEMFSIHGFDAATLRQITDRAGVNLAAVNYYFRSKDALIQRVLERSTGPILARLDALDAAERRAGPGHPALDAVVEAIVRPTVTLSKDERGGRPLIRLLLQLRALPRPEISSYFEARVDPVAERFVQALQRACPSLPRAAVHWRYNFALGAVMQVLTDSDPAVRRLHRQSGGRCDTDDDEEIVRQLVAFVVAGFSADPVMPHRPPGAGDAGTVAAHTARAAPEAGSR